MKNPSVKSSSLEIVSWDFSFSRRSFAGSPTGNPVVFSIT
jgi:hypothetical protein